MLATGRTVRPLLTDLGQRHWQSLAGNDPKQQRPVDSSGCARTNSSMQRAGSGSWSHILLFGQIYPSARFAN